MDWTTGLCGKDIITLQESYIPGYGTEVQVALDLGTGFLSSHVSFANFNDDEKGLCGRLIIENSLSEHVQEVNKDILHACYCGLNCTQVNDRKTYSSNKVMKLTKQQTGIIVYGHMFNYS